jgi:hypothetical protein
MTKAQIIPYSANGRSMYAVELSGSIIEVFAYVTEAQIYCLEMGIPFEPWV